MREEAFLGGCLLPVYPGQYLVNEYMFNVLDYKVFLKISVSFTLNVILYLAFFLML